MLSNHLFSRPMPKFVLIEDTISSKGRDLIESIIHTYVEDATKDFTIYYLQYETLHHKSKANSIVYYNFIEQKHELNDTINAITKNSIIIIDSLAHIYHKHGLGAAYKHLHRIVNAKSNVKQLIACLHTDLLPQPEQVVKTFRHLATLHLTLRRPIVDYVLTKGGKSVIRASETYQFANGSFATKRIKKEKAVESTPDAVQPEQLSTFKIGLSAKDKKSRSGLVLPYLPKDETETGRIHYELDACDDWDEEDPDDDLDI